MGGQKSNTFANAFGNALDDNLGAYGKQAIENFITQGVAPWFQFQLGLDSIQGWENFFNQADINVGGQFPFGYIADGLGSVARLLNQGSGTSDAGRQPIITWQIKFPGVEGDW
jgi:hypothetical protein